MLLGVLLNLGFGGSVSGEAPPAEPSLGAGGGRILAQPLTPMLRKIRKKLDDDRQEQVRREVESFGKIVPLDRIRQLRGRAETSLPSLAELSTERLGEIASEPGGMELVISLVLEQSEASRAALAAQREVEQRMAEAIESRLEANEAALSDMRDQIDALIALVAAALAD